jgi:hypothetical protein
MEELEKVFIADRSFITHKRDNAKRFSGRSDLYTYWSQPELKESCSNHHKVLRGLKNSRGSLDIITKSCFSSACQGCRTF